MASRKKHSRRERFQYWFDNKMAQGFWPKVRLLLVVTLVFVVVVGLVTELSNQLWPASDVSKPVGASFVETFMYTLGKGGALTLDKGPTLFILMLIAILYCMFFSAILIGLINNALRSKVEELGKGQSRVLESGHTLILGYNDAAFVLLGELIEADRNQSKPQTTVVLGDVDRTVMVESVRKRFGHSRSHPMTRIICRTGSTCSFSDLKRCAIEDARVIVIASETDFETVKSIMACTHILKEIPEEESPFIVTAIHGPENLVESKIAAGADGGEGNLEILSLNEVLARIMVHTSRQPGLSDVFTELFNFKNDEFYIVEDDPSLSLLRGKCIAEINHYLQMSYAVGVCKRGNEVVIGPPLETFFEEGDYLIVVKEDDDALRVSKKPGRKMQLATSPIQQDDAVNVLVIGIHPILDPVLLEYASYLQPGSKICIVGDELDYETVVQDETRANLEDAGITVHVKDIDASRKRSIDALLNELDPECVLILTDEDASDPEHEDELTMRMLLYLRSYRKRHGKQFSITSEMLKTKNKELAAAIEPDDFIISRQFSALLLAQISQQRQLSKVFGQVLSSEGFEVYMKPASWYVPLDEPVDLISAGESVAEKGEIFMGIRQKIDGRFAPVDINPSKYVSDMQTLRQYVFGAEDFLVVLAQDSKYPGAQA